MIIGSNFRQNYCKAPNLVFRYTCSDFSTIKNGLASRWDLRLLKKKSCNCQICSALLSAMIDLMSDCGAGSLFYEHPHHKCISGNAYKVRVMTWDEDELVVDLEEYKQGG